MGEQLKYLLELVLRGGKELLRTNSNLIFIIVLFYCSLIQLLVGFQSIRLQ